MRSARPDHAAHAAECAQLLASQQAALAIRDAKRDAAVQIITQMRMAGQAPEVAAMLAVVSELLGDS